MKRLSPGNESAKRVELLLSLTKISSQAKRSALTVHLVEGLPASRAYARFGVTQQHFSEALERVNRIVEITDELTELKK